MVAPHNPRARRGPGPLGEPPRAPKKRAAPKPRRLTYEEACDLVALRAADAPPLADPYFLDCYCGECDSDKIDQSNEYCLHCARIECDARGLGLDDYTAPWVEFDAPRDCARCGEPLQPPGLSDAGVEQELDHFEEYGLAAAPREWQAFYTVLAAIHPPTQRGLWLRARAIVEKAEKDHPAPAAAPGARS